MKTRYLTPAEIERIFAKLPPNRRIIFEVALETGMRIGDVLKIRKRDIAAAPRERCEIKFVAEKTGKRAVAIINSPRVAKALLSVPKGYKGYLFGSYKSRVGHITRQAAWKWFKEAAAKAEVDVEGCSPHSLRKSFASDLRHKQGLDAVQKALQHTNSFTTAIYAYADVYAGADPLAPILWGQVEELMDLIVARLYAENVEKIAKKGLS